MRNQVRPPKGLTPRKVVSSSGPLRQLAALDLDEEAAQATCWARGRRAGVQLAGGRSKSSHAVGGKRQHADDEIAWSRSLLGVATVTLCRHAGSAWVRCLPPQSFPDIALQITAMAQDPVARGGIVLPGGFAPPMKHHFRKAGAGLLLLVKHTLWEGQNVLAHCMAGRHWGASAGAVLRSIMSGDSLEGKRAQNPRTPGH